MRTRFVSWRRLARAEDRTRVPEYVDNLCVNRHFERIVNQVPSEAPGVALAGQDDVWQPPKRALLTWTRTTAGGIASCSGLSVLWRGMMVLSDLRTGCVVMGIHRPSEALLSRQIASLKAQSLNAWTCLIGIDGLDRTTSDLVSRLIADDERFSVATFDANVGVYRHFERLLVMTPHDAAWVALCDQDDVWYENKLAVLVSDLDRNGIAAAMGQARLTDSSGRPRGRTDRRPGDVVDNLLRNQVTGSMTVLRADVVRVSLPFPTATRIAMHDHWLGTCAAAVGVVQARREVLQDYVQHDGNVLGEVERPSLESKLGNRSEGGLRPRVDRMALERWGWRVSMATTLEERSLVSSDLAVIHAVASGRVTLAVLRAVASGVRRKRLDARRAVGILLCAMWWKGANRRRVDDV